MCMPLVKDIQAVKFELYDGRATKDALDLYCVICGRFAINVLRGSAVGLRKSHTKLHVELAGSRDAWKSETHESRIPDVSTLRAE